MEEEKVVKKESNFLWGILGFFVPLAGIILFFVWKKDMPQRAKASLIGFIVYLIMMVLVVLVNLLIFGLVIMTSATSDTSDYDYTSPYDSYYNSYYDSKNTKNNTVGTNTTNTTNTISNTNTTSNSNTISNSTNTTNTMSNTTTNTTNTITNTTATNTTANTTTSNGQRVGTDEFGYVTVPNNWVRFMDPDAPSTYQYSYAGVYIVTLYARNKSELSAKDSATNSMYHMQQEGAKNVTGATVTIGKYTAYQVYGYYSNENIWLVSWHFEAEDNKVHYVSMEGPDSSSEFFKIPETFSLKK